MSYRDIWYKRSEISMGGDKNNPVGQTNKSLNSLYKNNGRRQNNELFVFSDGVFHTFRICIDILRCPIHQSKIHRGPEFGGSNRRIPVFDLAIPSVQRMDESERTTTDPFRPDCHL